MSPIIPGVEVRGVAVWFVGADLRVRPMRVAPKNFTGAMFLGHIASVCPHREFAWVSV